jgi:hypothetical protein
LHASALTRIDGAAALVARGPTRALPHSPDGADRNCGDFLDAILCGLLAAQATWIATRDPAALRRELIAVLAGLG